MLRARLLGEVDPSDAKAGKKGWKRQTATLPDLGTYPAPLAASLAAELHKQLKACLESDAFLPQGGLVGVPCMHLYEQVCFSGSGRQGNVGSSPPLGGGDR